MNLRNENYKDNFFSRTDENLHTLAYQEIKTIITRLNNTSKSDREKYVLPCDFNKCTACKYAKWDMSADFTVVNFCRVEHDIKWTKELEATGASKLVCDGYMETITQDDENK